MATFSFRSAFLPLSLILASALSPVFAQKLSGPAATQANRVLDASSVSSTAQVKGHVPFWVKGATDLGPMADSDNISLVLNVSRSPEVEASFQQLLLDLQNPASPRFHQWLTPQQVGELYGPTQHDVDALTAWLGGQGITVDAVMPSRIFVEAHASAAVVGHAFQTSLHNYTVPMGTLHAPTTEPTMPASLAGIVGYVGGLASVPYQTHHHFADAATTAQVNAASRAASAKASAAGSIAPMPDYTTSTGYHALTPNDFTTIYDLAPTYAAGIKGTGYPIAIIGGSQLTAADVSNYETLTGLPTYSPTTIVPTATSTYAFSDPGVSVGDQTEGMLDFERAYGTAPGATIDFIISKGWLNGTITQGLLLYAINTKNDPILSLSFGACEALQSSSYLGSEASMFSQAASQGISVFVSSGDAGVEGCAGLTTANTLYASISDYCSSANVTCVGGTEFADSATSTYWNSANGTGGSSAISYIPEGGWNDPAGSNGTYRAASSGGGVSTYTAKPSYQTGTGVPADGARDVPDISFSGSVHNAYVVCQIGYSSTSNYGCVPGNVGFLLIGGTSASAPSMAGVAALIDQKLGGRQGNMNPLLYKTFASKPSVFHDATPASSGAATNGVCTTSTPSLCNNSVPSTTTALTPVVTGYPLTAGFDLVTGLGSLDVNAFLTAVGLPTPTGVITATPSSPTVSQTVTFKATFTAPAGATGTPTGTVQFYYTGVVAGSAPVAIGTAATLVGGVATSAAVTLQPAGTYTITAVYSGDNSFSSGSSTPLSLIVTNPTAITSTTTLTVFPGTTFPTSTSPIFTATVKGSGATPTGTVQFFDTLLPKATVTLVNGVAQYAPGPLSGGVHSITCTYYGDAVYSASPCNAVSVTATALPSTTTATLSSPTLAAGNAVTLTFTVAGNGVTIPTGSVAAYVQGTTASIGSVTLSGGVASGQLTLSVPGPYTLYGIYSGDSTYATSQSGNVTVTVTGFAMSLSPSTLSVTDGATSANSLALTFTSVGGFVGSLGSSCTMTLNVGTAANAPYCSVNPSSVALAANGTASATVSVVSSLASNTIPVFPGSRTEAFGGVALAGLLMVLLPGRRRLLRNWRALSMVLFLSAALLTVAGCGSSSTASTSNGATTRGTYTLTVTTTSGNQQSTATSTVTIN